MYVHDFSEVFQALREAHKYAFIAIDDIGLIEQRFISIDFNAMMKRLGLLFNLLRHLKI